jgi:hypothetical protein
VLIVRSNAQASELAGQLRAELIHHGRVQPQVLARLADGNSIGVGDRIQARRNDPAIAVHGPGMITNRATYTVLAQDPNSGAIRVRGADGLLANLPMPYVAEQVSLAYAATAHATQGRSTDTSHTLNEPGFARRDVPATGRPARRLFMSTPISPTRPCATWMPPVTPVSSVISGWSCWSTQRGYGVPSATTMTKDCSASMESPAPMSTAPSRTTTSTPT